MQLRTLVVYPYLIHSRYFKGVIIDSVDFTKYYADKT